MSCYLWRLLDVYVVKSFKKNIFLKFSKKQKNKIQNDDKANDNHNDDDGNDDDNDEDDNAKETREKAPKKKSTGSKFASLELQAVIGESGSVSFFNIVKLLWAYIKANGLQKGRDIVCDDKLRAVFGRDSVGSFQMSKFLSQHMMTAPGQSVGVVVQPDLTPKPKAESSPAKKRKKAADAPPRVVPEESKRFVSTQVAAVIGKERATHFELTKLFWVYIKEHSLQSESNKRLINCDDKLKAVFAVDQVNAFGMSKYFSQHLLEKGAEGPRLVDVVQPPPSAPKEPRSGSKGKSKKSGKKAKVSKSSRPDADSDEDDDGNVDDVVESEGADDNDDDDEDEEDDEE
jgi:upstream activation factor subunit UAF30